MPEQMSVSWADRIKKAEEEKMTFKPIAEGFHNFEVEKATAREGQKGEWLNIQAKIIDGPHANGRVFRGFFPNSASPVPMRIFLEFFDAVGIDKSYLVDSNPTLQQIGDAFVGRKFSAEVFVEEDARFDERTNAPQRAIKNFRPQAVASSPEAPTAATPPAPQAGGGFGARPEPTAMTAPQAPAPQAGGSPWGTPPPAPAAGTPERPW